MTRFFYFTAAVLGLSAGPGSAQEMLRQPDVVDIIAGEALYAQNCAVCHGDNLEGAENWRSRGEDGRFPPPPHDETGHTWHHTDAVLFAYTALGGRDALALQGVEFDSGMPGFGSIMTEQEIWDTLAFIKSTWPEEIQQIQRERQ